MSTPTFTEGEWRDIANAMTVAADGAESRADDDEKYSDGTHAAGERAEADRLRKYATRIEEALS